MKSLVQHRRFIRAFGMYAVAFAFTALFGFLVMYFETPFVLLLPIALTIFGSLTLPWWLGAFVKIKVYDGEYREKIISRGKRCGIALNEVYVMEQSHANACAPGINRKCIMFTSHVFHAYPWEEIEALTAHELGHHGNKDPVFYTGAIALAFSGMSALIADFSQRFALGTTGFFIVSMVVSFVFFLALLAGSRWRESLADRYAILVLQKPIALAEFLEHELLREEEEQGVSARRAPQWFEKLWRTHSLVFERIASIRAAGAKTSRGKNVRGEKEGKPAESISAPHLVSGEK